MSRLQSSAFAVWPQSFSASSSTEVIMPRPASKEAKVRLNLDLPERVRERLERLQVLSEADSLTEVIKRALSVYDALLTSTREEGGKLILRKEDGSEEVLRLI